MTLPDIDHEAVIGIWRKAMESIHDKLAPPERLQEALNMAHRPAPWMTRVLVNNTLWNTSAKEAGGTLRWQAPEHLDPNNCQPTATMASDIYSYGMTCYVCAFPFKILRY